MLFYYHIFYFTYSVWKIFNSGNFLIIFFKEIFLLFILLFLELILHLCLLYISYLYMYILEFPHTCVFWVSFFPPFVLMRYNLTLFLILFLVIFFIGADWLTFFFSNQRANLKGQLISRINYSHKTNSSTIIRKQREPVETCKEKATETNLFRNQQ